MRSVGFFGVAPSQFGLLTAPAGTRLLPHRKARRRRTPAPTTPAAPNDTSLAKQAPSNRALPFIETTTRGRSPRRRREQALFVEAGDLVHSCLS